MNFIDPSHLQGVMNGFSSVSVSSRHILQALPDSIVFPSVSLRPPRVPLLKYLPHIKSLPLKKPKLRALRPHHCMTETSNVTRMFPCRVLKLNVLIPVNLEALLVFNNSGHILLLSLADRFLLLNGNVLLRHIGHWLARPIIVIVVDV